MSILNKFCQQLLLCAETFEKEMRSNINEFNNNIFNDSMNGKKLSLEKAQDYHRSEIAEATKEILAQVKRILFHQNQVEWLKDDSHFSDEDLKRFSYLKRQVYNFNNSSVISRSEENLNSSKSKEMKKERRRTVSEVSVETLEAWEKYLDNKVQQEDEIPAEIVKIVPKRNHTNIRKRKKFISSTLGGFLEDETNKNSLESIQEDSSTNPSENNDPVVQSILENFLYNYDDKISKSCSDLLEVGAQKECIKNISNSLDNLTFSEDHRNSEEPSENSKPKIVKVLYKQSYPPISDFP